MKGYYIKYFLIIATLLLTSVSISQPGLAVFHGVSKQLVIALNENGIFFRLTLAGG